jgi:hypothetical protein
MKAINLIAIISLLLVVVACVPTAEELAGINETEEIEEPEVEVKQEITIVPISDNKTIKDVVIEEKKENITNTTNQTNAITSAATQPPQIAGKTIVYTGGAIEMGEGEKANVIIK